MTRILRRTIQKDLNDLDDHDSVVTHLEPDILECEVKWSLASITMNSDSGGDAIPAELFKILTGDAVKVLHSECQQIWKTQQWSQDWTRSVFIPTPKKGNAKECSNYCTIALILYELVRLCSKSFKLGSSRVWTVNFQMFKLDSEKAEEQEIRLPTLLDHRESKGIPEKYLFLLHWLC